VSDPTPETPRAGEPYSTATLTLTDGRTATLALIAPKQDDQMEQRFTFSVDKDKVWDGTGHDAVLFFHAFAFIHQQAKAEVEGDPDTDRTGEQAPTGAA
jgi:hypothetical protein